MVDELHFVSLSSYYSIIIYFCRVDYPHLVQVIVDIGAEAVEVWSALVELNLLELGVVRVKTVPTR